MPCCGLVLQNLSSLCGETVPTARLKEPLKADSAPEVSWGCGQGEEETRTESFSLLPVLSVRRSSKCCSGMGCDLQRNSLQLQILLQQVSWLWEAEWWSDLCIFFAQIDFHPHWLIFIPTVPALYLNLSVDLWLCSAEEHLVLQINKLDL